MHGQIEFQFDKPPLILTWNRAGVLSREEVCRIAGVRRHIARHQWEDVEEWLREGLDAALLRKTKGKVGLLPQPKPDHHDPAHATASGRMPVQGAP